MNDCEKFIYVFKDHWCNIEWENPAKVPDNLKISDYERKALDKDPVERAESNLSYGFNLVRYCGKDKLIKEQSLFIKEIIKELG